jgi:DHA1 family tetracycline resistance protein-like MFS transporter
MVNMTGVGIIWPMLPLLVERLTGGGTAHVALWYGALAVVFSAMQFLFAPVLGALSDRYGRRPVMLLALAGMGLDNLLLAFAPTLWLVFIGRAVGGIFGASWAVANACMADVTQGKDRAAAFGMVGAAFGVGFIIGPFLGGVLGDIDTRLPFLTAAGLSFANVAFAWFFLRETLPPEKRSARPLIDTNAFSALAWMARKPGILLLAIAFLIATSMQRGLEAVWVLFTGVQYGWGVREAGISLAIVGASYVVVQGFLVRRIVARIGERIAVGAGFALSACIFALLAFNTSGALGYLGILPHVLGWGVAGPALQALASQAVGPKEQGFLQGGLTAAGGLAAIIGPAMATGIFAWFNSQAAPFPFPGAFFLAGAGFLLLSAWLALGGRRARFGN